jgi:predicted porin
VDKNTFRATLRLVTLAGVVGAMSYIAPASAEGSVQLYGLVGAYVGRIQLSGKPATNMMGHGGMQTSFWGMRGTEPLGNGYSAIFALEGFFQPTTGDAGRKPGDPFFSRNAYVGINSPYGRLTLGRQTNPTYINMQQMNPFGASTVFSPIVLQSFVKSYNSTIIGDTVWDNAIEYKTPRINGVQGTVVYAPGGVANNDSINNFGLHLSYKSGPLYLGASYQRVRTGVVAPSTSQTVYLLGGSYDFKWVRVYAAAERTNSSVTDVETNTYEGGVRVPVSASGAVLLEWARTRVNSSKYSDASTRDTASLGYDYSLSKRTDLYAVYSLDKIHGESTGNSYAVGIRHMF